MVIKLHIAADRSGGSGESLIYFCIVFADRVEGSSAHIGFHLRCLRDRIDGETGLCDDRVKTDMVIVCECLTKGIDGV